LESDFVDFGDEEAVYLYICKSIRRGVCLIKI